MTVMPSPADRDSSPLWWQSGVIYQIYPRSFQDSNADGIGDLRGVIQRLGYLSDVLGVDAIWLSPFFRSPMADFGYDVSNYTDVAGIFGTLTDFDDLVREAHEHGLHVIIDFVPNHTSDQHPWFVESRSFRANPKRDWYIWRDPRPDGGPPNNWLSVFGGPAWQWDEGTGQYYLHMFLPEQPDLNWRNPEVRQAMLDVLRFWLDRDVDGFRIDAAQMIMKDPELRDDPPNTSPVTDYKSFGEYDSLLHVNDQGHPDIHDVYREIRRLLESYSGSRPRAALGEIHIFDYLRWAEYYGSDGDEIHLPLNFGLIGVKWQPEDVRRLVDSIESVMRPGMSPTYVLGNHDEHRIASRVGVGMARLAHMLLLTLRGTPTIYEGDELGMIDVPIPPEAIQDPWGLRTPGLGLGRDPERTPMQWDSSRNAGFCPPDVKPWLPISGESDSVNVEHELADPVSMLNLIKHLLHLRRTSPALHSGSYLPVDGQGEDCFVYLREHDSNRVTVALNFSDHDSEAFLGESIQRQVLLSTHMDRSHDLDTASIELRPHEGCILVEKQGRISPLPFSA